MEKGCGNVGRNSFGNWTEVSFLVNFRPSNFLKPFLILIIVYKFLIFLFLLLEQYTLGQNVFFFFSCFLISNISYITGNIVTKLSWKSIWRLHSCTSKMTIQYKQIFTLTVHPCCRRQKTRMRNWQSYTKYIFNNNMLWHTTVDSKDNLSR